MTLLGRALREVRSTEFQSPFRNLGSIPWASSTASGMTVTHETAMTYSAVFASVSLIAESIMTLPVGAFQDYPPNLRFARPTPSWLDVPNPESEWPKFCEQSVVSMLLGGDAFWGYVRTGDHVELWPLDPRDVNIIRDPETRSLTYWWQGNQLDPGEIIHIPGLVLPGQFRGLSPVECARQTIGLGLAAEKFGASVFENAALPHVVITSDKTFKNDDAEAMAQRFDRMHAGLTNAHRTAVLGGGAQVKELTMTNDQLQFLESRKFQVTDVARWFRVPPHMIGDVEKSSSWGTGIEQQQIMFVQHTLMPWIVRIEAALTRLYKWENPDGLVRFNVNGLLRGDSAARAALYDSMMRNGAYSPNDIRRKENENPYNGGDSHWMQTSYAPIGPDGALMVPDATPTPPPVFNNAVTLPNIDARTEVPVTVEAPFSDKHDHTHYDVAARTVRTKRILYDADGHVSGIEETEENETEEG